MQKKDQMSARDAETALRRGSERPKKRVGLLLILLPIIFFAAVAAVVHRRITDLDRTRGDITHKIVETAESLLAMGAHVEGGDCDIDFKGGELAGKWCRNWHVHETTATMAEEAKTFRELKEDRRGMSLQIGLLDLCRFISAVFVLMFVALFLYEFMYMPLNGKYTRRT